MKKRHAIGWALAVFFSILFAFGILWAVLYYGGLQPMYTNVSNGFGAGIFDVNQVTFVQTFIAWWPFIVTICIVIWLWQRSNKRDLVEAY